MNDAHEIYAVVFDQGTLKIGRTMYTGLIRIKDHRRTGDKFGISVFHEMTLKVPAERAVNIEVEMIVRMRKLAKQCGHEWFKFPDAPQAVVAAEQMFQEILDGPCDEPYCWPTYVSPFTKRYGNIHPLTLIKNGKPEHWSEK